MRQWGAMAAVALAARVMAVPVSGVVRQVDGLPAVGAKVSLRPQLQPFVFDDEPATATLTKAAGQFALEADPGTYEVIVGGAVHTTRQLLVVRAGEPVTLRLGVDWPWAQPPTASGVVQVLHADGRPAPVKAVELAAVGHLEPAALDCGCQCDDPALPVGDSYGSRPTDSAGRASFKVRAGLVTLGVRYEGAEQVTALLAKPGGTLPEVTLRLPKPGPAKPAEPPWVRFYARIQVLSADGKPFANQWVQLRNTARTDTFAALTDADGVASVHGYFSDDAAMAVKAPGWCESEPRMLPWKRRAGIVQFPLRQRAQSLSGVLRDTEGHPLADGWVFACRPSQRHDWWVDDTADDCVRTVEQGFRPHSFGERRLTPPVRLAGWVSHGVYFARTAADGSYRFDDLEPGLWHVVFLRRGYLPAEVRGAPLGGTLDQALTANHNRLSGTVRGPDGQPWAQRCIAVTVRPAPDQWIAKRGPDEPWLLLTDEAGRYDIDDPRLPVGYAGVTLRAGCVDVVAEHVPLVTVLPTTLDFDLPPQPYVTGRVLLPDGQPAAQAWVGHGQSTALPTVWTDADGRFRLPTPKPGPVDVVVFADGCAAAGIKADTGAAEPSVVRLTPGASLTGRVVLNSRSTAYPYASVPVRAATSDGNDHLYSAWAETPTISLTQAFAMTCLAPGPVRLTALPDRYGEQGEAEVNLPSIKPVTIRTKLDTWASLGGIVLGPNGQPLAGATVRLSSDNVVVTKADGRFDFRRAWPHGCDIEVTAPGLRAARQHCETEAGRRTWVEVPVRWTMRYRVSGLPAGWAAAVRAVTEGRGPALTDGVPPLVAAIEEVAGMASPSTEPAGKVLEIDAEPGEHEVWAYLAGSPTADCVVPMSRWNLGRRTLAATEQPLDVALPAERAGLKLTIDDGGTVSPWPMARFAVLTAKGSGEAVAVAGYAKGGVAHWPCLPPGEYDVSLLLPGRAALRRAVSLRVGETATASIGPAQGVVVKGHVSGAGMQGLVCLRSEQADALALLAKDGSYRIDGVPPGSYRMWYGDDRGYHTHDLTVAERPVTLDLTLPTPAKDGPQVPPPAPRGC